MKKYYVIKILTILFTVTSCSGFLEEKADSFLLGGVDVNATVLEAQLQGAYKSLLWYKNDRQIMVGVTGTDEAQGKTVEVNYWAEQGALDKYNVSLNSDNWLTAWMWNTGYFGISRANMVIRSAKNATGISDEQRRSTEAEARYVRAMNYFTLAQYFGKLPLITENTIPVAEPSYPREGLSVIYKFIIDDLEYAETNLKTEYRRGRATIGAAKALMMKTYMHAQPESGFRDYAKAKKQFEEIELFGKYSLQEKYEELFMYEHENGVESVYEFQFGYPDEASHAQYYTGSRAIGEYGMGSGYAMFLPTKRYLNLFADGDGDERLKVSVRTEFYQDGSLITSAPDPEYIAPHCKKYEDDRQVHSWNSAKNIYYIRYADLILLYAECLNEEGKLSEAKQQVKRVRDRAKVTTPIVANTKDQMLDFIYEERMRELGMEGWRRFDLTRRGADYFVREVDKYNAFAKGNVRPHHVLYPIPSNEINMNKGISAKDQNPGYN